LYDESGFDVVYMYLVYKNVLPQVPKLYFLGPAKLVITPESMGWLNKNRVSDFIAIDLPICFDVPVIIIRFLL